MKSVHLREITMERQSDRDAIAEEAVGQRHGSGPPDAATGKADISQEEAARQLAASSGAQASIPEKTAVSVGERVGDAYSDPESVRQKPKGEIGQLSAVRALGRKPAGGVPRQLIEGRFATVVASFALGYITAVLLHDRINRYFGTTQGPFQITKPPQGDRHPGGFVQSTVLKAITEHPQGMTTAEIIRELGPQGIGEQSVADALGALVRAKKVGKGSGAKYFPAAVEVPTAPDQPSS
jgi:hypothetical protein